jgi:hypothetical protein
MRKFAVVPAFAVVIALAGCSSSSSTDAPTDSGVDAVADSVASDTAGSDSGTGDSGATDSGSPDSGTSDAPDTADASTTDSDGVPGVSGAIACGKTNCKLPGSVCCASAGVLTDRACQPITAPCGKMMLECDDSSECPSGSVCCGPATEGKKVVCVPASACAVSGSIFIWCTSADSCPAAMPFCNSTPFGYSTCVK